MERKITNHIERAISLSQHRACEAKIVKISIIYTPRDVDANIIWREGYAKTPLLLYGREILEYSSEERTGFMNEVLQQFKRPRFAHIEIDKAIKPTIQYKERGHNAKGEVVFECEHYGTITDFDKSLIHDVLHGAYVKAAYIHNNVNVTSVWNGERLSYY